MTDPLSDSGAYVQTRTDLAAHGGEPGDNLGWLRATKRQYQPTPGRCRCGAPTTREITTSADHITGRVWGLRTVRQCERCAAQARIAWLRDALARPADHPWALSPARRAEYEAMVRELEGAA